MIDLKNKNLKICIIGLGYVGLPLFVALSHKYKVIGYDISNKKIKDLKSGNFVDELSDVENIQLQKLFLTSSHKDIHDAAIYIVTVPTPVDKNNAPDLNFLKLASSTIGRYLNKNNIVIYESTVYPGATEEVCIPILEEKSSLILNNDFYVGYSPERINPGDNKKNLSSIIKIVSASNEEALLVIDKLYKSIIKAGTYKVDKIKVAETAKVIENTQRDLNIALMNELAIICKMLKIDTMSVIDAASTKWNFNRFTPGLVGGHCVGVDPYYLTYKAEQIGHFPKLISAGREVNDGMAKYIYNRIINYFIMSKKDFNSLKILIMGISFKENISDVRNSKSIDLIQMFKETSIWVDIFEPNVNSNDFKTYNFEKNFKNLKKNFYDSIIITVPHKKFTSLGINKIRQIGLKDCLIFDIKSCFPDAKDLLRL